MKLMSYLLIGPILFSVSAFAQAGNGAGNGGNGIVCFDNPSIAESLAIPGKIVSKTITDSLISHITSVDTLDLVEARVSSQKRSFENLNAVMNESAEIVPVLEGESVNQYLDRIISRFPHALGVYAGTLLEDNARTTIGSLLEPGKAALHIQISKSAGLIPAQDIHPLLKSQTGCVFSTLAAQRIENNEVTLVIDGRLFFHPKNSKLSQAALLLHETILASSTLANNSVLPIEAIRRLTSALIRQYTPLSALIKIINDDRIFKSELYDRVYYRHAEKVLNEYGLIFKQTKKQAFEKAETEFVQAALPAYDHLPQKFKDQHSLSLSSGFQKPLVQKEEWWDSNNFVYFKTLSDKNQSRFFEIKAIQALYWGPKYYGQDLENRLAPSIQESISNLDAALLLDEKENPGVSESMLAAINEQLHSFINKNREGKLRIDLGPASIKIGDMGTEVQDIFDKRPSVTRELRPIVSISSLEIKISE